MNLWAKLESVMNDLGMGMGMVIWWYLGLTFWGFRVSRVRVRVPTGLPFWGIQAGVRPSFRAQLGRI